MRQSQLDSLLGGGEAGKFPETPMSCLSFDLHYEEGGPKIFSCHWHRRSQCVFLWVLIFLALFL